jgi:fatty-acyl-CoA synthase
MLERLAPTLHSLATLAGLAPRLPAAALGGVPGAVRAVSRRRPDAPALRTLSGTLTWAEVDREADRRAAFWRAQGLNPGDAVALLLGNRAEVILQQLGIARLGGVAALVDHALAGPGLAGVLDAAGARGAVVDAVGAASLATVRFRGALGVFGVAGEAGETANPGLPPGTRDLLAALPPAPLGGFGGPLVGPDDVFAYVFTSGTTGLPKAARIRHHRWLMAGAGFQAFALWLKPWDVVFTPLPLHHSSAQMVGFSVALAAECCFAVAPRFSASHYWSQVRALEATVGLYVGETLRYLVHAPARPEERGHGLRLFVGNGLRADVWPEVQRRFGVERIVEFYGATEGNHLLVNRTGKVGSCGRLLPIFRGPLDGLALVRFDHEAEAPVRGPDGRCVRCADGEIGELLGRISRLPTERFDGYADAAATEAKILRNVFEKDDAWFRTGDLLRRDADGDFFFVDRIGDTFRWKGENVSTQAVADALTGRGGTRFAVAYGVRVPGCEGRAGMAAVTVGPEGFDPADLFAAATSRLPPAARPLFVRVCPAMDTTGTMKFRKVALQAAGYAPADGEAVWIRDDVAARFVPLTDDRRAELDRGDARL